MLSSQQRAGAAARRGAQRCSAVLSGVSKAAGCSEEEWRQRQVRHPGHSPPTGPTGLSPSWCCRHPLTSVCPASERGRPRGPGLGARVTLVGCGAEGAGAVQGGRAAPALRGMGDRRHRSFSSPAASRRHWGHRGPVALGSVGTEPGSGFFPVPQPGLSVPRPERTSPGAPAPSQHGQLGAGCCSPAAPACSPRLCKPPRAGSPGPGPASLLALAPRSRKQQEAKDETGAETWNREGMGALNCKPAAGSH